MRLCAQCQLKSGNVESFPRLSSVERKRAAVNSAGLSATVAIRARRERQKLSVYTPGPRR